jgi:ABC-type multidrug transport system fused ATPase/permease subunit
MKQPELLSKTRTFLSFLGPFRVSATILFVLTIISALAESLGLGMVLPLLEVAVEPDLDNTLGAKYLAPLLNLFPDNSHLLVVGGLTIFLIMIKNLLVILRKYYSNQFIEGIRKYWASEIMKNYLYADFASLLKQRQGAWLNNMIYEPAWACKCLKDMIDFFAKSTVAFFIIVLLIMVNWRITITVSCASLLIALGFSRLSNKYSRTVGKKKVKLNQQISSIATESISGVRQIKIFSMENRVIKEFAGKLATFRHIIVKFRTIASLPEAITETSVVVVMMGVLLYYHYIKSVNLTSILPIVGLFVVCAQRLFSNVSTLFSQRMTIISHLASLKLVHDLANNSSFITEDTGGSESIESLKEKVELRDISFTYPGRENLFDGLNMEFNKESITAVVGPSGSGKSTLCDLLLRFLKPSGGGIYVDGKNINTLNINSWRNLIGYIPQDIFLFNATVKENILIGKPDVNDEEVFRAAKLAAAHDFIEMLPQKYDTLIGDNGISLSGGERQRISIARALVRNPKILIFDEATSSLDEESERLILKSIKTLAVGKTVIIISHRFSTLKIADFIYFLDNGNVVESGTSEKLDRIKSNFTG